MHELLFELLLRLVKPLGAVLIGIVVWLLATGPGAAAATAELAILCWVAGAAMVLLVAEGPI
jgi:hypothetical protein